MNCYRTMTLTSMFLTFLNNDKKKTCENNRPHYRNRDKYPISIDRLRKGVSRVQVVKEWERGGSTGQKGVEKNL